MVVEMTGSASEIVFRTESEPDDPRKRCPDITKAGGILGWRPGVCLRDGLERTLDYFRAELAEGES